MTTYEFDAGGLSCGAYSGATLADAMEAFARDAGYRSWDDMTQQAIENAGAGNIQIRERLENGQLGPDIAPDQTRFIVVKIPTQDLDDGGACRWAAYVERRLNEKFAGAVIDVNVTNAPKTSVRAEFQGKDVSDEVSAFLNDLWDRELSAVFG